MGKLDQLLELIIKIIVKNQFKKNKEKKYKFLH